MLQFGTKISRRVWHVIPAQEVNGRLRSRAMETKPLHAGGVLTIPITLLRFSHVTRGHDCAICDSFPQNRSRGIYLGIELSSIRRNARCWL